MARIKHDQDHTEKRDEILVAARSLFIKDGYEATSMSRLAKAAGVAPNTIYWYFRDKDEILIAVLDEEFSSRITEYYQLPTSSLADRILWVADQLSEVHRLVSTVHNRLECSETVYAWHERFHTLSEGLLREELRQTGLDPKYIEARVKISVFTIEGILMHRLPEREKREICAALIAP